MSEIETLRDEVARLTATLDGIIANIESLADEQRLVSTSELRAALIVNRAGGAS